jgi:hypothetical protein
MPDSILTIIKGDDIIGAVHKPEVVEAALRGARPGDALSRFIPPR